MHLKEGELRLLVDETSLVSSAVRRHFQSCQRCQVRFAAVQADALTAASMLSQELPHVDSYKALQNLQFRLERSTTASQRMVQKESLPPMQQYARFITRPLAACVAAGAIVSILAFTPAGALAQDFLTLFQPTHVTAVPVSPGELQSLQQLDRYGTLTIAHSGASHTYPSASAASSAAGLPIPQISPLPAGVPSTVRYIITPGQTISFTFSATKAEASARQLGKALPSLPANLNGATIQFTANPALIEIYGQPPSSSTLYTPTQETDNKIKAPGPTLVIAEARAPTVTTTGNGVTMDELENYIVSLPGISPQLAQTIRSLGDPRTTLPVPVPISMAAADNVTLSDGTQAAIVGDSTGAFSLAIFERNGMLYGVGGTFTKSQVMTLASRLR
jgi:hypothetical protein